ncbi:MAG: ribosome silencing factor [Rhodobiaceae bacterium]|nr:ribosome silencing factor [Rhodobiaceae bacterium]
MNGIVSQNDVPSPQVKGADSPDVLLDVILATLDDAKAEDTVTIDLHGKSSMGDYIVVTSGRSNRHVGAIADQLSRALKDKGYGRVTVEGLPHCDWVLIDAKEVIVHVFRPEVREFYNLEKMWLAPPPEADREPRRVDA